MSVDFGALTQAVVAGLPDVRSCLIVSRDGLALGAFPAAEEDRTLEVWTRIAMLGDVERGFVTVRDEVWVFCRRGAYGAIATAPSTARPGLILDHIEQMVLMAEEARVRKEGFRQAAEREPSTADPSRGLRSPLHRDRGASPTPESVFSIPSQQLAVPTSPQHMIGGPNPDQTASGSGPAPEEHGPESPAADEFESEEGARRGRNGDDSPVDRAELSREFAAILAEHDEEEG
jgi:hypothetical protein